MKTRNRFAVALTIVLSLASGDHFFVETHPENGDNVDTGQYPGDIGPNITA